MFLLEIENMNTESSEIIWAKNNQTMHDTLMSLGFECIEKYEFYVGLNEKGEEISIMTPLITPVKGVNPVNKKHTED